MAFAAGCPACSRTETPLSSCINLVIRVRIALIRQRIQQIITMSHPGITEATLFHTRTCHDGTATSSPTNRPSVSPSRRQLLTHQPSMSRLQFDHLDLPVPAESPHRIRTTMPSGQRRHAKVGCVGWGTMTDAGSPTFFQYSNEHHKRPFFTNPQNVSEVRHIAFGSLLFPFPCEDAAGVIRRNEFSELSHRVHGQICIHPSSSHNCMSYSPYCYSAARTLMEIGRTLQRVVSILMTVLFPWRRIPTGYFWAYTVRQ